MLSDEIKNDRVNKKLNYTGINPYLMHMHFNAYLMKKVFFGCGIIELKDQQDRVLRKMHETTIANKLRLGNNFLRAALCSRKNAIGIGMIKMKTVMTMLVCKLHMGNVR